jgi:hypothetical protein
MIDGHRSAPAITTKKGRSKKHLCKISDRADEYGIDFKTGDLI